MVAGITVSIVEIGLTKVLQLLLSSLGVSRQTVHLPLGSHPEGPSASTLIGLLIGIGIIRAGAYFLINQSASIANENLNLRLRMLAFHETLVSKKGYHSLSDLHAKLGEVFPKATTCTYYAAVFIPNLIYSACLLAYMASVSALHTAYALAGVGFLGILISLINRKVKKVVRKLPQEHAEMMKRITHVVQNVFLLKALRTTDREHEGLKESARRYSTEATRASFLVNLSAVLPPLLGIWLLVLLIAAQGVHPTLSPATFICFVYILLRSIQVWATMATQCSSVVANASHFNMALDFAGQFSSAEIQVAGRQGEIAPVLEEPSSPAQQKAPLIELINVSFGYRNTMIFEGLNMKIPAGAQCGLTGPSGCGKSTLLALMLGVLEPDAGRVLINGEDAVIATASGPLTVGYVGADAFLMGGTLRENLLYGLNGRTISDEACLQALADVRLDHWVNGLSDRLDYQISENEEGLSAGQRQRLSLARALLMKPKLLILDEYSANLDAAVEGEISEVIARLKGTCTTIIASHRVGALQHIDCHLDLGKVSKPSCGMQAPDIGQVHALEPSRALTAMPRKLKQSQAS